MTQKYKKNNMPKPKVEKSKTYSYSIKLRDVNINLSSGVDHLEDMMIAVGELHAAISEDVAKLNEKV